MPDDGQWSVAGPVLGLSSPKWQGSVDHTGKLPWHCPVMVCPLYFKSESLMTYGLQGSTWFGTRPPYFLTSSSTILPPVTSWISWCFSETLGLFCLRAFTLSLPSAQSSPPQDVYLSHSLISFFQVFAQMPPSHQSQLLPPYLMLQSPFSYLLTLPHSILFFSNIHYTLSHQVILIFLCFSLILSISIW